MEMTGRVGEKKGKWGSGGGPYRVGTGEALSVPGRRIMGVEGLGGHSPPREVGLRARGTQSPRRWVGEGHTGFQEFPGSEELLAAGRSQP